MTRATDARRSKKKPWYEATTASFVQVYKVKTKQMPQYHWIESMLASALSDYVRRWHFRNSSEVKANRAKHAGSMLYEEYKEALSCLSSCPEP